YFGENMEVVATEKHVSEYPNPFYLKQGDKVALGAIDDEFPNWIFITSSEGMQGWAPVQYIEKIEGISEGILRYDYDNVELNTVIGEKLSVQFELNEWYRVSRSTGEIGWVPVRSVQRT
ncbi:SH3 domain-containing protein, partial [Vibrio alginolyticus]|nr:SH3 domain-containing protein [Vibrio alginolyticus]